MTISDYDAVYALWLSRAGMGLNDIDDSQAGIAKRLVDEVVHALDEIGISKAALVVFDKNQLGNDFWESQDFSVRQYLVYRNKSLRDLVPINT